MASQFDPIVSIVGFHHARGPEVEHWVGVEDESTLSEWPLLPFMALSDGAHSSSEDFSYFTLKHVLKAPDGSDDRPVSLFGISCTRQLDASTLIERSPEVTRSTVQKAVVVIADTPVYFGGLKEKLGMVTRAWFAQRNFEDLDIIRKFQESLKLSWNSGADGYLGLSLRELVFEFRQNTLVLFKCCLLQPKMLFFGSRCDRLCMTQFSLLSLIPGLLGALEDCADPELNYYERRLFKPTSVKTSDRKSLLTFMGMPLQIFGKGSLFGPYTPLQQLDILADVGTKSYIVGSTNSLLLQQKDRYSDILINLDEHTINITSSSLRTALYLTAADRRWIDSIVQAVAESWDENDPSRPNTMGFVGSEDYIRLQFEEYCLSMVSSVKCHDFLQKHAGSASRMLPDVDGDPAFDFGMDFIDMWKTTENYRIFQKFTDSELFDLVPPKHVMAGGLTMDDVSRRISQQLNDLKLDEKMINGREAVAKTLVAGRGKLGAAFSTLTSNVAQLREAQGKKSLKDPEPKSPAPSITPSVDSTEANSSEKSGELQAQPARTGYFAAWASWAGEKRKKAFGNTPAQTPNSSPPLKATSSEETTSAANSIGSPKIPVNRIGRESYGEEIYDAVTGIGKGDSGFISPPYRPSLDMHPHAQAHRTGSVDAVLSQDERRDPDSGSQKGLFAKLSEKFVDVRKSLPAPPLPEKESRPVTPVKQPEIPERSEEDKEFLRNLRKSLPPPPSEIDYYPPMLRTPGPAAGPLVAQEVVDTESIGSPSRPLSEEINPAVQPLEERPKVNNYLTSQKEEKKVESEHQAQAELAINQSVPEQQVVTAPKEPSTTRFKARNLIRQYVAQETEAQTSVSATEEQGGHQPTGPEKPIEGLPTQEEVEEQDRAMPTESRTARLKARRLSRPYDDAPVSTTAEDKQQSGSERQYESSEAEVVVAIESRTTRLKARRLSRAYLTEENVSSASIVVDGSTEQKSEEPPLAKFKARNLIRRYVTQEQEAEREQSRLAQEKPTPETPEHHAREVEAPEYLRRTATMPPHTPESTTRTRTPHQTLDPRPLRAPTMPATTSSPGLDHRRTKSINAEESSHMFKRKSVPGSAASPAAEPRSPENPAEATLRLFKRRSLAKLADDATPSDSTRTSGGTEASKVYRRKSIPKLADDVAPSVESSERSRSPKGTEALSILKHGSLPKLSDDASATGPESPHSPEGTDILKISKRKSIGRFAGDVVNTSEVQEMSKHMKRKSLRQFGAEYPTVDSVVKEKEKKEREEEEKERERKRERERESEREERELERELEREREEQERELERARERERERELERARERERERELERERKRERKRELEKERERELEKERKREREKERERELERIKEVEREIERTERQKEKEREKEKEVAQPPAQSESAPPPPLIKRKTIPAVFAQADAEHERKATLARTATGFGSIPARTPSPGTNPIPSATPSPSERRIGSRSRSGTLAGGPPNLFSLNKPTSPSIPGLPSIKDLPKRGIKSPSALKDSSTSPSSVPNSADRPRTPFSPPISTTIGLRKASIEDGADPAKTALNESRIGPGRIGGGLKDNPFLKKDAASSPTLGSGEMLGRKRVGTIKNNPFIQNDVKSPTSPPPAGGR